MISSDKAKDFIDSIMTNKLYDIKDALVHLWEDIEHLHNIGIECTFNLDTIEEIQILLEKIGKFGQNKNYRKYFKALGTNGINRLFGFLQYKDGWDFGMGKSLSNESLEVMRDFLKNYNEFCSKEPFVFLTLNGNVQISWKDKQGNAIEIEFFPESYHYYFEAGNNEGTYLVNEKFQLINRLLEMCA